MTTPSLRAHLLRATHEWLSEHGHTPYVQVLVDRFVQVPPEHVRDGVIVLNMSYDSTNKLLIGEDWIEFQARFNGQVRNILFPTDHVVSLFSKETQEGYQAMSGQEFAAIREGHYQLPEEADEHSGNGNGNGNGGGDSSSAESDPAGLIEARKTRTSSVRVEGEADGKVDDKAEGKADGGKKPIFTRIK